MMRIINPIAVCWMAAFSVACNNSATSETHSAAQFVKTDWAEHPIWDDGKAEVAIYQAERIVYGKPRQFEYIYVLVKETFNEEFHAKTDDYSRDDLYEVMKINKFCRIPTEAYPYHYLTSVFLKREEPSMVHKLTNTSQEWCGNTAKSFIEDGDSYTFDFMSYWDGQGNGTEKVPAGPWFEDQLSYTLRTLDFQEGLTFDVPLYPSQVTNKADVPVAEDAHIAVTKSGLNELDSASISASSQMWKISVKRNDGPDMTFWFNEEYPHHLLQMISTDGRKLLLKHIERDAYWAKE